jgi:hypothetical protein
MEVIVVGLIESWKKRRIAIKNLKQHEFETKLEQIKNDLGCCGACRYKEDESWGNYSCKLRNRIDKKFSVKWKNTCDFYEVPKKFKKHINLEEDK